SPHETPPGRATPTPGDSAPEPPPASLLAPSLVCRHHACVTPLAQRPAASPRWTLGPRPHRSAGRPRGPDSPRPHRRRAPARPAASPPHAATARAEPQPCRGPAARPRAGTPSPCGHVPGVRQGAPTGDPDQALITVLLLPGQGCRHGDRATPAAPD